MGRWRIPIWLGTFGPRALAVTGRQADGRIPSHGYFAPHELITARERVLAAARKAGRDPAELTCAYNVGVRVGGPDNPDWVCGSPEAVVDQLAGIVRLGFTTVNFMPRGGGIDEQVERLATEVVPALRAAC